MRPGKEIDLLLAIRAKARSAVLASYPTDTATGDPANFPDGADGVPVVDLKVAVDLTQSGSGLPSSENIRPITLWTGATISHSGADTSDPEELTVSWANEAGNVCAGTLDVTTGVLTVTYIDISDLAANIAYASSGTDYVQFRIPTNLPASPLPAVKSDRLSSEYSSGTMNRLSAINISGKTYVFGNAPKAVLSSYDQDGLDEWVAQAKPQFVIQLTTPATYQIPPAQLRTLLGENYILADTGAVTVEYRADLDLRLRYVEPFVVTLTPTAADYSGIMDKTPEEIAEACKVRRRIRFAIPDLFAEVEATQYTMDRMNMEEATAVRVYANITYNPGPGWVIITIGTSDTDQTYETEIFPLE